MASFRTTIQRPYLEHDTRFRTNLAGPPCRRLGHEPRPAKDTRWVPADTGFRCSRRNWRNPARGGSTRRPSPQRKIQLSPYTVRLAERSD